MWTFFDAVSRSLAGYIASIYSWPRIKLWVNGAKAEIAKPRSQGGRAQGGALTMWRKVKAFCLNSLTMAWGYLLAFAGAMMQGLDTLPMLG